MLYGLSLLVWFWCVRARKSRFLALLGEVMDIVLARGKVSLDIMGHLLVPVDCDCAKWGGDSHAKTENMNDHLKLVD